GSIAPSYPLPAPGRRTGGQAPAGRGADALTQGAGGSAQKPPITLEVSRPLADAQRHHEGSRPHASSSPGTQAAPAATGKVRLFAHPGNPDALAAAASRNQGGSPHSAAGQLPLRAGAVVGKGTVLRDLRRPPG